MNQLKFSKGSQNAKLKALGHSVYTFSLPSGWSCPGAKECLGKAVVDKLGKVHREDGKDMQFRCFSASQEVAFPAVRKQRQYNFDLLQQAKGVTKMRDLIESSLPSDASIVRVHVAGDLYNMDYFKAWIGVAINHPNVIFYAYTKSLNYWVKLIDLIPANLKLTASKGGRYDNLIQEHGLKYAEVVYSEQEALDKGLDIDHDDRMAIFGTKSFALLIHGNQKKGTIAAEALKKLKGVGSYGKGNKSTTPE